MRRAHIWAALAAALWLLAAGACARADDGAELDARAAEAGEAIGEAARARLKEMDMSALEAAAGRLTGEEGVRGLLERMLSGDGLDAEALMQALSALAAALLRGRAAFMLALGACAALGSAGARLCGEGAGARVSETACVCVAASLVAGDVAALARGARETIGGMGELLDALMPLSTGVTAALGAQATAGLMGGTLAAAAGTALRLGRDCVTGLAMASAALEICAGLNPRVKLMRAAELARTLCGFLVGAALVVALGAVTVNGSLGADIDGVSVRATKYALDNLVPVVGGQIKDTVEVMAASCRMVQGVLGSCGALLLVMGAARPALTLAAAMFSYRICAALSQLLGAERLGDMAEGMARVLRTLMAAVLGAAALAIMLIGALGAAVRALLAA